MKAAAVLAGRIRAPLVVCLSGPLGAGKTTFVRGILRALGHRGVVPSPTFAMVNEYRRLKPRLYHMDLYRAGLSDLPGIAMDEYIADEEAVCLIEWPDAAMAMLPADRVEVVLEHAVAGRRLSIRATGPRTRTLIRGMK